MPARTRSFHRIDTEPTGQRIRVSLQGEVLAESDDAVTLLESGLPPRWYLPREDVRVELLDSDTHTVCPFKGQASYHSVKLADGEIVTDLVWYYPEPIPEARDVAGRLCFYNERVEIELDGGSVPAGSA